MKTKNGFVTNSSSTSFIVFIKKLPDNEIINEIPMIGILYDFLINAFKETYHNFGVIETIEKLDQFYSDMYGYDTIQETIEEEGQRVELEYNEAKEYIKNGYAMLRKRFSYDDEESMKYFEQLHDGENIIVWN